MQLSNLLPVTLMAYTAAAVAIPDGPNDHSHHDAGASPATSGSAAAAAAGFAPAVNCRNKICYSAVVPAATASSGSGPIWFQIYAPTTFSWVALGTGTEMADANMFIIYQDGKGNVTLSHRQASGHTMPQVPSNSGVTTTLLPGTGVSNGFMVANFRCDNCTTWKSNQKVDFSSQGTPMIGAWREGSSLDSADVKERITQHTGSPRIFSLNLANATKSTAGNPFVGDFAVPAEAAGAANGTDGGKKGDSAGSGRFSMLSGSVAVAAIMTGFSFLL